MFSVQTFKLVNMYRVYLGNLDEQVTEPVLQKVFADHSLPVTSILIKRGYGFVDCPDQTTFDQTIDRLNGAFVTTKQFLYRERRKSTPKQPQIIINAINGQKWSLTAVDRSVRDVAEVQSVILNRVRIH